MGSLTGAVSSKKVTEEYKGTLSLVGNQALSARVEGCLTARPISRADAKAGPSDPVIPYGRVIAHQIKGTLGITGLSLPSVHSGGAVWHLNKSGCCRSNPVPTNRLITVNPSAKLWLEALHASSAFARRYRGKSSVNTHAILNWLVGYTNWKCMHFHRDPAAKQSRILS